MTNSELIKNYTSFHAYFCHLIDKGQADAVQDLCDISFKLDQEISKRKISETQIKTYLMKANLSSEDQLLIGNYIYDDLLEKNNS
jgi:hypothetical protein